MSALFNLPSADTENVQHFNQLLNTVNESINVFTSLKRPFKHWGDIIVYCVTEVNASPVFYLYDVDIHIVVSKCPHLDDIGIIER